MSNPRVSATPGGSNFAVDPSEIQLNTSRLSHRSVDSTGSAITLGGVDYHVGSRIGKSGAFVIGDPTQFDPNQSYTSIRSSQTNASQKGLVHATPIEEKGYSFEDWNWPIVRLGCLILLIAVMIALLATVIGICVEHRLACDSPFEWYHGSVMYRIFLPYFADADQDYAGDIIGMINKMDYLSFLGVQTVLLSSYLASQAPYWDAVTDFMNVDSRIGNINHLQDFITASHTKDPDLKVILELSPVYTSINHAWFSDSALHKASYSSPYEDFYVWSYSEGAITGFSWSKSIERDMFYLHYNDSEKPLLNWGSARLQRAFVDVMDFWLQRGVDGFVIRDMEEFYGADAQDLSNMIKKWREKLDEYNNKYKRILVLESEFLDHLPVSERNQIIGAVDLVIEEVKMGMNDTYSLQQNLLNGIHYTNKIPGPWTLWEVSGLRSADLRYVTGVHMYTLMLPGTPLLTAGQETGRFYRDIAINPLSPPQPILWRPESVYPYNPGLPLNETTIMALKKLIDERNNAYALREDSIYDENQRETKEWNFNVRKINKDFLVLERKYKRKLAYYYIGNYNDLDMTVDLSFISGYGNVLTDTSDHHKGSINLMHVSLTRGQAIVFSVAQ